MASKAELIERANTLRRNEATLRKQNQGQYLVDVAGCGMALENAGFTEAQIEELLPASLLREHRCRLQPLADHVVIQPAAAKTATTGGILIPDSAQEVPMRGTVLAVGPGRIEQGQTVLMAVAVGQDVLFGRYAGTEVVLDGEAVRIMREEDLLGILAPESA